MTKPNVIALIAVYLLISSCSPKETKTAIQSSENLDESSVPKVEYTAGEAEIISEAKGEYSLPAALKDEDGNPKILANEIRVNKNGNVLDTPN